MTDKAPTPHFCRQGAVLNSALPTEGLSGSCTQLPESRWSVPLLSWCAEIQSVLGLQPLCDTLVSLGLESSRHSAGSSSAHGRPTPQGHGLHPRGLRLFLWDSTPEVDRAGLRVTLPCTLDKPTQEPAQHCPRPLRSPGSVDRASRSVARAQGVFGLRTELWTRPGFPSRAVLPAGQGGDEEVFLGIWTL